MRTYFVPEGTVGSVNRGAEKYPIVDGVVALPTDLASELGWTPVPLEAAGQGDKKQPDAGKANAAPTGSEPHPILAMKVDEAIAHVGSADAAALEAIEIAELANKKSPGGRKGVMAAIVDRRKALEAAAQGDNQ